MGRHRRSAAGSDDPGHSPAHPPSGHRPVARDIGRYPAPEAYAEATAKAQAYLFATDDAPAPAAPKSGSGSGSGSGSSSGSGSGSMNGDGNGDAARGDRRWIKAVRPVRAALLGVSVAVVLGTVTVATGAVPGLERYGLGGGTHTTGGERVGTVASPGNTASEQGGTSGSAGAGTRTDAGVTAGSGGAGGERSPRSPGPSLSLSPSPSRSASASKPAPARPAPSRTATGKPTPRTGPAKPAEPSASAKPSASVTPAESTRPGPEPTKPKPAKPKPSKPETSKATPSRTAAPSRTPGTPAPAPSSPTDTVEREAAVEAEVLKLVNDERAKAGLGALAANSALTGLAEAFSDDMAARGFFAHTDPDGRTPWDRAARAGVTGLGGENIGRGQADAAAVLAAWMDSPENRANILNPGFTAFGAGVRLGTGGPWWTLEFGN
ncbi:CAP domain-containing protein [Streptomyces sp. NPDC049590]|uniref:CAP domain-containing protein n=1 Tax=Streptomyces sp. NPDC049590 TaxID=3154834 RepID=UPI00343EB670